MSTSRILVLLGAVLIHAFPARAAIPTPPQNVQPAWIYEGPANYARLTWSASEGATSYNVYRQNTENPDWYLLRTGVTNLMYRDYDATSAPKSYVVTAVNSEGESIASELATAQDGEVFPFLHSLPTDYFNWNHQFGWVLPTSAQIIWYIQTVSGADGMLEFGNSVTNMETVYFEPAYQMFGHGTTLTNLTPATPYFYRITSVYTNRTGYSAIFSLTTPDTNHPPVAGDVTCGPVIDPWELQIILPVSDPENSIMSLTLQIVSYPTNGTLSGPYQSGFNGSFYVGYTPNPSARGVDHFQYVVNDGELDSSLGTVLITNIFLNTAPTASIVDLTTLEEVSLALTLPGNDADGDPLTFTLFEVSGGTLAGTQPNLIFTPFENSDGSGFISYEVSDGYNSGNGYGVIFIDIIPVNDKPIVLPQSFSVQEDGWTWVWGDFTDIEGGTFALVVASNPAHGTVITNSSGWRYQPDPNWFGTDSFQFVVVETDGLTSDPGTVTIEVAPVNDVPQFISQLLIMAEDSALAVQPIVADPDGDAYTIDVMSQPTNGWLEVTATGYLYHPSTNAIGLDRIVFAVTETNVLPGVRLGPPQTIFGQIQINVTNINDAPQAGALNVAVTEDTLRTFVLAGSDVDGDSLVYTIVTPPTHGSLNLMQSPLLRYTPHLNFNGTDSLTYTVSDGKAVSAPATVTLTVNGVNDLPVPQNQSATLAEDGTKDLTLAGNDADGDALTFVIVSGPTHGTLTGSGANWTYQPTANYNGTDAFTFRANDGVTNSALATVSITVTAVNDTPWTTNQSVVTAEETAVSITPLAGDVEGDALTFTVIIPPSHGTATVSAGQLIYTPALHYTGSDSFHYRVQDPSGSFTTGQISMNVTPVNDAPTVTSQSLTTAEDVSTSVIVGGSDVEGSALTIVIVNPPANGSLSGVAPNLTYTPSPNYHGPDAFTFKANDGELDSAVATVTLNVTSANDAPNANSQAVAATEDLATPVTLAGSDVDGDSLTYLVANNPAHGTLSGTAPNLIYTPAANYNGPDAFTFLATDGSLTSAVATVSIAVAAVNDAPQANAQSLTTPYNTSLAINLTGSDPEGSSLSYALLSTPANGTLSGTAPNLTFVPNIGWSGTTSFTFRVNDGALNSASATVTIIVQAASSIPAAPSALTATAVSSSQINLTWADNSANEDGFKIERSTNGSSWTQIASVGPNVATYASTGLASNKTYYYRVRAFNVLGNSAYSGTSSAKTLR